MMAFFNLLHRTKNLRFLVSFYIFECTCSVSFSNSSSLVCPLKTNIPWYFMLFVFSCFYPGGWYPALNHYWMPLTSKCLFVFSSLSWPPDRYVFSASSYWMSQSSVSSKQISVSTPLQLVVVVVQSVSRVRLFVTPWTAAHQASLSFTTSQSLLKLTSIALGRPSNYLILLLLLSLCG